MADSPPTADPAASANTADLVAQVQASNDAAADAAQALQEAATAADAIAAEAQSAATPAPAPVPLPELPADLPLDPASLMPPAVDFAASPELRRLLAIEVPIIVQLGTRRMSVGEVMRFAVGAIVEFSKAADEDLELLANNRPIGKGQAVKVGENFGIKLTAVGPVKDTIRKLGGIA